MPDWFGPNARMSDLFETTLRNVSVRTSIRLEKCYLKHGTSIAVRPFVIDTVVGGAIPVTITRASIRALLGALTVQIGRATARDRVCRIDKIWGVAEKYRKK